MPTHSRSVTSESGGDVIRHRSSTPIAKSRRVLGNYILCETLHRGSVGKVKLATHVSGAKFAIKILPRNPRGGIEETRVTREAAISLLLYHPNIWRMQEMIVHEHHYYMVFEHVDGVTMLDYIIQHGRLGEKAARKFARQIGSALEYCHQNNIVHRDLKIEHILVSKTNIVKIADFHFSNLYNPQGLLSTFCGSSYFPAPELLNKQAYEGPKVDIWSFGVIFYILVCGKVPFDDQSMPALHAKVKRGVLKYPKCLSSECKHLLSAMLRVDPAARASLPEVLGSSWMTQGFDGLPETHIIRREPLRVDQLDECVLRRMEGFGYSLEDIKRQLIQTLDSDEYKHAVQLRNRRLHLGTGSSISLPDSSLSASDDSLHACHKAKLDVSPPTKTERLLGSVSCLRSLFTFVPPLSRGALVRLPAISRSQFFPLQDGLTKGFHSLVSIYHLTREKMERERLNCHLGRIDDMSGDV